MNDCILGGESFEPASIWPQAIFDPAEDLPGFVQYAADVSYASNEFGLMVYMRKKDSTYFLLFVEALDSINEVKVLGAKKIPAASKPITFKTFCSSMCTYEYLPLGMIEINSAGQVHTMNAWTVDKKKKMVYRLKPETVDCQEAYDTDYD
jgi:hypothetical protein